MSKKFKYNLNIYYQATIIYFVAFVLYVIIRGEFVEDSFNLILRDPILYLFLGIVIISLFTLIYKMYLKKFIQIDDSQIILGNKFQQRKIKFEDIEQIKIFKKKLEKEYAFLRIIRLKIKNRKRGIVIRTSDYENEEELVSIFQHIKNKIESRNV
ncbi:MAG: hypothetical protein NZM09_06800 [Ignavibacterium sp.]|nr:hypothetical protein [Ignavibacterium sp.]MDW8375389.1 hypothetical protein [Ignavibacteriales bacterium]